MAKENFISWLEEKVEELRKTLQRNVVPIPNPREAMRQFEDDVMTSYLSFSRKAFKKILHPFRDYNLEDGVKEEAGKIQNVLYDAVNDICSREKRIKAVEQKIDLLTVDRAYLINYHGQLEHLAGMLPKVSAEIKQDKEEPVVESGDGNKKKEKGEIIDANAKPVSIVSHNIGHIVALSSLDEQAEYVTQETACVDILTGDYTKKINEEHEKLSGLTEELRTYMHDANEKISANMFILHRIELFKEFAERYATKDTNPFIVERLNKLLAPYTKVMKDDELDVSSVSGVNEVCLKLAGSFVIAKMLQGRNSGEITYMSDGVMNYFKEMTRIITN